MKEKRAQNPFPLKLHIPELRTQVFLNGEVNNLPRNHKK